ncbi:AcrR family transcriptional regulator [Salibacterium salarium]|uniref:TetR/AcrR family transcriptional regulator n=1 Tax=Salibacterium salarium TaxID=284579 RepID=UPI00277F26CC|nr:TetR/AcrR family transcriptional regulator [Salibacterium salarium]MDQ0300171.1 AcrR family transcriptional regulator [Salibacterium salarium]
MAKTRKEIQRDRMWHYFIDATAALIEEEGLEQVTIRKVAERAGFTSSTAYNYFGELSHLIFFASMRFMQGYIQELPNYMKKGNNKVETWLHAWRCFSSHSFRNPHTYAAVFINNLGAFPGELLQEYYNQFSSELVGVPDEIIPFLMEHNLEKRSSLYLQGAVEEGLISAENVDMISDVTLMIWRGMMTTLLNNRLRVSPEEAEERTMSYVIHVTTQALKPGMAQYIVDEF